MDKYSMYCKLIIGAEIKDSSISRDFTEILFLAWLFGAWPSLQAFQHRRKAVRSNYRRPAHQYPG